MNVEVIRRIESVTIKLSYAEAHNLSVDIGNLGRIPEVMYELKIQLDSKLDDKP